MLLCLGKSEVIQNISFKKFVLKVSSTKVNGTLFMRRHRREV